MEFLHHLPALDKISIVSKNADVEDMLWENPLNRQVSPDSQRAWEPMYSITICVQYFHEILCVVLRRRSK